MINELRNRELQKRYENIANAKRQDLIKGIIEPKQRIHVVYVMEKVNVCGGVKIILQHANKLVEYGMKITIICHFPFPTWFPLNAEYIQVPFGIELAQGIPDCDLVVATYYRHIHACIETGIAPVVYFEQGDNHLFEYDDLNSNAKVFAYKQYQLPEFIFTVSHKAASYIKRFYNREAKVIYNAIDNFTFNIDVDNFNWTKPYILMMGQNNTFKGIEEIVEAVKILRNDNFDIDLIWITPEEPVNQTFILTDISKIYIAPSQDEIARLYRGAELYVSASHYESFSLPVIEAMSCGCAVVTTRNAGVLEYAEDNVNVLLANINDPKDLAIKIKTLLENSGVKSTLIRNGIKTSQMFSWDQVISELIEYYNYCSIFTVKNQFELFEWNIYIEQKQLINTREYKKLIKSILNSSSDIIQIPRVYNLIEGHYIARWETVATRRRPKNNKMSKVFVYAMEGKENLPYKDAYVFYNKKDFINSFNLLTEKFKLEKDLFYKAVYAKWMLLCLIELEKDREALDFVGYLQKIYPDFTDLYYIINLMNLFSIGECCIKCLENISILGDAVNYPEFFYKIKKLVK